MLNNKRANKLTLIAEVERAGDANKFLQKAGQAVIVNRGSIRSIIFSCPDGCGELLTINLDPRAGKAWKIYRTNHGISLFPSVWRDNGCESHFIVWRDNIVWFGVDLENSYSKMHVENPKLDSIVLNAFTHGNYYSYIELAEKFNEIPWDVLQSCNRLVTNGKLKRGTGQDRDFFKLV